jgi:death on curing protein
VIYLSYAELLYVAERATGERPAVRDAGLLEAACARPKATVFGSDAYPTLDEKAAALAHSIARNHALVDGNKRLALAGLIAFLGVNGRTLTMTNDEAYDLIIAIAAGELDDISSIAATIGTHCEGRA